MHLLASIWLSSGIKRFSLPRSIESAQRTNCVPNNVIIVKLGIMHSTGWHWHTNRGGIYRIPSHHVYCDNYLEFSTVQLVRKLRDHVRVGHDKKTKICWVKSDHFQVTWSSASTKTNTNFCLLYMYKFIWPCHYLGQRRWPNAPSMHEFGPTSILNNAMNSDILIHCYTCRIAMKSNLVAFLILFKEIWVV